MRQNVWTYELVKRLAELYPTTTNAELVVILGVSCWSIKDKAKKLGLEKGMRKEWIEVVDIVRNNFHDHSYRELEEMTGASKRNIIRIAKRLGLKRTAKETRAIRSRCRKAVISKERRHMIFGLDAITNIKVNGNLRRNALRCSFRKAGYLVTKGERKVYYSETTVRRPNLEIRAKRLGVIVEQIKH